MPETADSRTRIYVLARELGEQPKEVLERARRLGFPVTTVLHSLAPNESSRVSDSFSDVDVGVQPGAASGSDGGEFSTPERDAVTAVTIISVEDEAGGGTEATAASQRQDSLSVVADPGRAEPTVAEVGEATHERSESTVSDTAGDEEMLVARGAHEPAALLHVVKDSEGESWEAQENGRRNGGPVDGEDTGPPDAAIEDAAPDDGVEPVGAMAGDPWEIDAGLEDAPHPTEPDVEPAAVEESHGPDSGGIAATSEHLVDAPGDEDSDSPPATAAVVSVDVDQAQPTDTDATEESQVGADESKEADSAAEEPVGSPIDGPDEEVAEPQPVGQEPIEQGAVAAVDTDTVEEPGLDAEADEVRDRQWPWRFGVAVWALLIVAVAVGGAVLTATNLPDVQRAESDVIVRLAGFDFSEIDRQLDSYVVVAESETVIGPAAREIGMSPLDLRDAMTVGLVGDSAVIRFGVEDVDGEVALVANSALVQQYLSVVNSPADESLLIFIDGEIAVVDASLVEIDSSLSTLARRRSDNAARRAGLIATQETLRGRLVSLYSRRTDITTGLAIPGTSLSTIQAEIDDVQGQLDTVTSELEVIEAADAADEAAENQLLGEQAALRSDLARLEDRRVGLGIDQLGQARARVLTSPHMIADSVTPSAARGGAFGLAVGLILAVVFIVFVSRLRRRQ